MVDPEDVSRRVYLSLFGTATVAGLAGCSSYNSEGSSSNTGDGSTDSSSTQSTVENRPGEASILTQIENLKLPPIWNDEDIEEYRTELTLKADDPDGVRSVTLLQNGEPIREFDSWNGQTQVQLNPEQVEPGENTFTIRVEDERGETVSAETAAEKRIPSAFKIDVVPQKNEELRERIRKVEGDGYLERHTSLESGEGVIEEDLVFDTYSSHEDLVFDKLPIDLAAYEYIHDNNWWYTTKTKIGEPGDRKHDDLLETIDDPEKFSEAKEPTSEEPIPASIFYPNANIKEGERGEFVYEKVVNADSAGEALDWLHPLLFQYQAMYTYTGPESSEDFRYSAFFQEALDRKTDIETYVWKIQLPEGHGNGLIWDETNDELRVMETISGPPTLRGHYDDQSHPTIKEANYMKGDWMWHPLRFGLEEEEAEKYGWEPSPVEDMEVGAVNGFEPKKREAMGVLIDITAGTDRKSEDVAYSGLAPTTEYVESIAERFRNYDSSEFDFQQLLNQSKAWSKLADSEDGYVVYGTVDEPKAAKVIDNEEWNGTGAYDILDKVKQDKEGKYDDFDKYIPEHASYDEINRGLEPENSGIDDAGIEWVNENQ